MAIGKSISNQAAMYGEGRGPKPEIAMPPLDESTQIAQAPNPWNNTQQQSQHISSVPDELPQEVQEAMEETTESQEVEEDRDETSQTEEVVTPAKNKALDSFKALREAKEAADRERDYWREQAIKQQRQEQPQVQVPAEEDLNLDFNINDDDLAEGKHLKKTSKKIMQLENKLREYELRMQCPDLEKVLSSENIQRLNSQYPEIAIALRDTPNEYTKTVNAYRTIKRLGLDKTEQEQKYDQDIVMAKKNAAKPRPLASVNPQQGDSPLSKANAFANGLTEDLKKQMMAEMNAARKAH